MLSAIVCSIVLFCFFHFSQNRRNYRRNLGNAKRAYVSFLRRFASIVYGRRLRHGLIVDDAALQNLAQFEIDLAKITPDNMNNHAMPYETPANSLVDVPVEKLEQVAPGLNWALLFRSIGQVYSVDNLIDYSKLRLTVNNVDYFKAMSALLEKTLRSPDGSAVLQNYITLQTVSPFFCLMASPIVETYNSLTEAVGFHADHHRHGCPSSNELTEPMCYESAKSFFGPVVSRAYINRFFPVKSHEEIEEIAEKIRQVFINRVENRPDWMDENTAAHAIEKANAMMFSVGYPYFYMDDDIIEKMFHFHGPLDRTTFLDNSIIVASAYNRALLNKLDSTPNRREE